MQSPNVQKAFDALVAAIVAELQPQIREELRVEFLGMLGGANVKRGKPGPKPRAAAVTSIQEGARRSAESIEQLGKEVLAYVRKNPDQRVEQIAKGMGTDTKTLKLPIAKLLSRPAKLATKGVRRGTTYRAK